MELVGYVVALALVVFGIFFGLSAIGKDFGTAVGRLFVGLTCIVAAAILFVLASGIVKW